MARFFFCLCLVLSLCMDGSRWSAALASGSFGNGNWWGAREFRQLGSEAARLRRAGGVRVLEHHYRSALQPMLEARRRARMTADRLDPADFNLSSLYLDMWDLDSAVAIADEGAAASEPRTRDRLNLKLTGMEADAGLLGVTNQDENFRTGASLTHLRRVLSNRDLFLSYSLGDKRSYLWALTRESLHLYALAPSAQISSRIKKFREQIRDGLAPAAGSGLYDEPSRAIEPHIK